MRKFLILALFALLCTTAQHIPAATAHSNTSKTSQLHKDNLALNISNNLFNDGEWPMAAANPQRTSWTTEEVRGVLTPAWYKPFEPYIPQRVQIIAANNLLYIATARGLYALDAASGTEVWVYPTEFPLGHSPTIADGVAYVGGLDRKLHAIDALTGNGLWTFSAEGGFVTNPLVVNDKVYLGSRDGYFYAIHAEGSSNTGQLAWKYKADGPILYSAAYQDNVLFFASEDGHTYALNSQTGALVWKSTKLPGAGFQSWWPVIYENYVIFSGSNNYRDSISLGPGSFATNELREIYPNYDTDPTGTLVGNMNSQPGEWVQGTPTIETSRINAYFNQKPWRRTVFVLDRTNGNDAVNAPVLWTGTHSGSRYPPVVGGDGVLYQPNNYMSHPFIAGGQVAGWVPGVNYISVISSDWGAVDEPHAASAGGDIIYWNLCCDRQAGAVDITIPNSDFLNKYQQGVLPPTGPPDFNREWFYFNYNLESILPNYNIRFFNPHPDFMHPVAAFDGSNGVYGFHGDTNPPIPYNGKVYMHRSNAILAFDNGGGGFTVLPMATTVAVNDTLEPLGTNKLNTLLENEVQKILAAGHLRPGYTTHGIFDLRGQAQCGDEMVDYWHNSAETIYILLQALPYLPPATQQQLRNYIENEFLNYPPYHYNHVGWQDGAPREFFDTPPEVAADMATFPAQQENHTFKNNGGWNNVGIWGRNPFAFYALWKYAEEFGGADTIYQDSKNRLEAPPGDTVLINMPLVHNAFIAGYHGFLELESLAGQPETTSVRNTLNHLLTLRANNFTKDSAYGQIHTLQDGAYCRTLNISSNFTFMVPELAQFLRANAYNQVVETVNHYEAIAPYWFVGLISEGFAENAINPLYDKYGLYLAKALILEEPRSELEQYIDVPNFAVGDLFYIHKLILALDDTPNFGLSVTPANQIVYSGKTVTYTIELQGNITDTVTLEILNLPPDLNATLQNTAVSLPTTTQLTVTDLHPSSFTDPLLLDIAIKASAGNLEKVATVHILLNPINLYLPIAQ